MNEQKIINLIKKDEEMMEILKVAKFLNLPDWMIGAGFVRNKVWDTLHKYNKTPLNDIDLIYFDQSNINEEQEKIYEGKLKEKLNILWSVKNQARMHLKNSDEAYTSSEQAMSKWPETATAVGVKLTNDNDLKLIAPYGVEDLVNLKIRINPNFSRGKKIFKERIKDKKWLEKWPGLEVVD